ncbi:hypothetical protein M405DRAFT_798827 [Rhizopogon salebrosus TDB-379]|nr:hypothetical protein M405DRAFT_798827 [Rhizopogon salebrosus TDB-379]
MSAIEKIKETWTSSSITTLFRLCPKADIATPFPLQSPIAGFNWRLIMSWAPPKGFRNRPSKYHLFFSSNDCPSAWSGAPITVTLSFPMRSHHNGHVGDSHLSTTATLGGDKCLLITRSIDDLVDSLISLEVSFTNLPTQNLFDALACVSLAPEAPASANAEEPNIPQARTALRALDQSIKTGKSFDIIFHAYTRRLSTGKITRPIPIYASTTVLEGTTLLPDFSEEDFDFSSLFELLEDSPSFTSESFEYESDSDLDDEEAGNLTAGEPADELVTGGETSVCHDQQSRTPAHDVQPHEDTTDTGSISSFSSFEAEVREQPNNRTSFLEGAKTLHTQNVKSGSRAVLVKGVAWKTWHAFVYYCYTGVVNFSGLRSQAQATTEASQATFHNHSKEGPPCCSPKSMYQLARKLRNDTLAQLAFKDIETRLSAANILDEALSKFTARHEAIREMELALLVKYRGEPDVLRGLPAKIEAVAMGNMPHAGPILTALYQRIVQMPSKN